MTRGLAFFTNTAWGISSTVYTILDAVPGKIVFGRDMLFDLSFWVSWNDLRKKRGNRYDRNGANENNKRLA